jgi:hypothetical protein
MNKNRGRYSKPLRDEAIKEIRRLVIEESYTPTKVMHHLQIPPRTFRRYMHDAFAPEREVLLTRLSDKEVLNQPAIMESRLTAGRREVLTAARDPNMDPRRLMAIIEAHHLTEELAVAIFKIHREVVPEVVRKRALAISKELEELEEQGEEQEEEQENENNNV